MLNVYMFRTQKPPGAFDLSMIPLDELADAVTAIVNHHTSGDIWFGYLEGWMLSPREETLLRPALRNFPCSCVCYFPLALPHAWKNEIDTIYTADSNGARETDNNGRIVHNSDSAGHDISGTSPTPDRTTHQGRKARRSQARRVQEGPSAEEKRTSSAEANDGIRS